MTSACYLPAGYEDSDEDELDGFYIAKGTTTNATPKKTEIEILRESLKRYVMENDVEGLRNELDRGTSTGFDIDAPIEASWSLLFHACYEGFSAIVEFLIRERNANVSALNEEGLSSLMIACTSKTDAKSTFEIVTLLLDRDPRLMLKRNAKGETAMMIAARNGHTMVIEHLIQAGDSVDNVNNSGRNALFYAIEGRQLQVAMTLFEHKIDYTTQDCRGDTAKRVAEANLIDEILHLFPPEKYKYETPSGCLSYGTFESIIPNTTTKNSSPPLIASEASANEEGCVPSFFPDIVCMLRGMDLEKFIPLFSKANISLEEFLTIDGKRLEKIGIELPCQRKMILLGLHNFFNEKWSNKAVWLPTNINSHISPLDLIYVLANVLRQTIVIKSQLLYLKGLRQHERIPCDHFTLEHFEEFQNRIRELSGLLANLPLTKRPLLIPKQNQSLQCNTVEASMLGRVGMNAKVIVVPLAIIILSAAAIKLLCRK